MASAKPSSLSFPKRRNLGSCAWFLVRHYIQGQHPQWCLSEQWLYGTSHLHRFFNLLLCLCPTCVVETKASHLASPAGYTLLNRMLHWLRKHLLAHLDLHLSKVRPNITVTIKCIFWTCLRAHHFSLQTFSLVHMFIVSQYFYRPVLSNRLWASWEKGLWFVICLFLALTWYLKQNTSSSILFFIDLNWIKYLAIKYY